MTIIQLTFVEVFREFRTNDQCVLKEITSHNWSITCSQLSDLLGTFAYSVLNCMALKILCSCSCSICFILTVHKLLT